MESQVGGDDRSHRVDRSSSNATYSGNALTLRSVILRVLFRLLRSLRLFRLESTMILVTVDNGIAVIESHVSADGKND